jgi:two-component system, NtrC family, sensor histidine kinase PilS
MSVAQAKPSRIGAWYSALLPNVSAFWYERALRFVAAGRLLLATGGLAIQGYFVWYLQAASMPTLGAAFAYWCFSLVAYLTCIFRPESRGIQAAAAICGDMIASLVLHAAVTQRLGGANAMLYVWPVIEAAVLGSSIFAGIITVGFTVFSLVLTVAREGGLYPDAASIAVLIFAALGMLVVGSLLHSLVTRLAQQEWESSEAKRLGLRSQTVARLALSKLEDGMLVVTRDGRLDFANPMGLALLAIKDETLPIMLADRLALKPLMEGVQQLINSPDDEIRLRWDAGQAQPSDAIVSVQVERVVDEDAVIVLLRNASEMEARLHEAKLASMGRLVAAIAHEVRNPLSAITQAAELMREHANPGDARLVDLILTNSARINHTVSDVLTLGRRVVPDSETAAYDLREWLAAWLDERRMLSSAPDRLRAEISLQQFQTRFNPEQLRRVLNNLLENAERYASKDAGAIWLKLTKSGSGADLVVGNDGPVIEQNLRASLFEPFVSTESRGTGLGLYISHELCANNGAQLSYQLAYSGAGEFVVSLSTDPQPRIPA